MKVTQWFRGGEKPVRAGWYLRHIMVGLSGFWYFDGDKWRSGGHDRPLEWVSKIPAPDQHMPWRGLAEKP